MSKQTSAEPSAVEPPAVIEPRYFHQKNPWLSKQSFFEDKINLSLPNVDFIRCPNRQSFKVKKFKTLFNKLIAETSEVEACSDAESAYEDERGKQYYRLLNKLGKGSFSKAYKLAEKNTASNEINDADANPPKAEKVVLLPVHREESRTDWARMKTKYLFYKLYYGEAELFLKKGSYRLVVPYVPGQSYRSLRESISEPSKQTTFMLATIEALYKLHKKQYVFLDLHPGNLIFDSKTGQSHLIDGDMMTPIGAKISNYFHFDEGKAQTGEKWYPPECWKKDAQADVKIDIYALGYTLTKAFKNPHPEIAKAIQACMHLDPEQRPTLKNLQYTCNLLKARLDNEAEVVRRQNLLLEQETLVRREKAHIAPSEIAGPRVKPSLQVKASDLEKKQAAKQEGQDLVDCFFSNVWSQKQSDQAVPKYLSNGASGYQPSYRFLFSPPAITLSKRAFYPHIADVNGTEEISQAGPDKKMKV